MREGKTEVIRRAREILDNYRGKEIRIMEVCGTYTHEIFRQGIRRILPPSIRLISGPGCPVCVTPVDYIDEAVCLALEHGATICTFGDLVRVPGSGRSLMDARGQGARIRVVYAPQDAAAYARNHGDEQVVFLSVGFETTTPSVCLAVQEAEAEGLVNFSILTANKTMPAAYEAMRGSTDAFLYPGHVHAITGTAVCEELAARGTSGVVAGFTARELLTALAVIVKRTEEGSPFFENCYPRVVRPEGSPAARRLMDQMLEPCDARWRGIGILPDSGVKLREKYAAFDARVRFALPAMEGRENPACRCGEVLQGKCLPADCGVFGTGCTPEHPVGACMVSGEGACSAFYLYGG
ncbi:MAG: hydrogenase formation protein HypD [Lachnospiraceae bacterium]|nr:hydrogenase formation protein HypD [Lachnospiraceae bacterium]